MGLAAWNPRCSCSQLVNPCPFLAKSEVKSKARDLCDVWGFQTGAAAAEENACACRASPSTTGRICNKHHGCAFPARVSICAHYVSLTVTSFRDLLRGGYRACQAEFPHGSPETSKSIVRGASSGDSTRSTARIRKPILPAAQPRPPDQAIVMALGRI
jgi:hypothetical protein